MADYTDIVKLIKKSGEIINNIEANAQPDYVFIQDEKIPVEEGDIIERTLPSGIVEKKEVIDPGYFGKNNGFPAYQCKVKSVRQINNNTPQQVIYNISDTSGQVNIHSHDNSIVTENTTSDELFDKLNEILKTNIEDNTDLIRIACELRVQKDKPGFLKKYQEFITMAASHMAIIGPFVPALSQLINQ